MRKWLQDHFLPMWAKETVLADNRHLQRENDQLKKKIKNLEWYCRGLETGFRCFRRIKVCSEGEKYENL